MDFSFRFVALSLFSKKSCAIRFAFAAEYRYYKDMHMCLNRIKREVELAKSSFQDRRSSWRKVRGHVDAKRYALMRPIGRRNLPVYGAGRLWRSVGGAAFWEEAEE